MDSSKSDTSNTPKEDGLCLPQGLDAGDIVLFNRRCLTFSPFGAAICFTAKAYARSRWDHIGIIVKDPDGSLHLLDAGFGGVRKFPLRDRLERSKSDDLCIRRLAMPRTNEMRQKLSEFSDEVVQAPYKKAAQELLRVIKLPNRAELERLSVLKLELEADLKSLEKQSRQVAPTSQPVLQAEHDRVQRQLEVVTHRLSEEGEVSPGKAAFESLDISAGLFCSELVAAAFQRLDVLSPYPPATGYSPSDFSDNSRLFLLNQAFLGPPEYIKKDSRWARAQAPAPHKTVDPNLLRDVLKSSRLEDLPKDQRKFEHFAQCLEPVLLQPGQVLFSPGEFSDAFYIVESGELERLMHPQGTSESVVVGTLGRGSGVGLRGLLYDTPRTATCRATQQSVVWRCDRATFHRFCLEFADRKAIRSRTERRKLYNILTHNYLFKRLDRIPGPEVVDSFFPVSISDGDVLCKDGERGKNFYIINSGEVELRHKVTRQPCHPSTSAPCGGHQCGSGVPRACFICRMFGHCARDCANQPHMSQPSLSPLRAVLSSTLELAGLPWCCSK